MKKHHAFLIGGALIGAGVVAFFLVHKKQGGASPGTILSSIFGIGTAAGSASTASYAADALGSVNATAETIAGVGLGLIAIDQTPVDTDIDNSSTYE